jgi:hypothetical protein
MDATLRKGELKHGRSLLFTNAKTAPMTWVDLIAVLVLVGVFAGLYLAVFDT